LFTSPTTIAATQATATATATTASRDKEANDYQCLQKDNGVDYTLKAHCKNRTLMTG
jgi:hypothetical protein